MFPSDSPVSHSDLAAFLAFEDVVESNESVEYGNEIASFMKHIETKTLPENPNYMESQPDLSFRMRKTLIVWLVEVHNEYDLRQETLYLAINILDRFCARRLVPRAQYQLLGITALWIAAKYEENHGRVPSLRMLCYICCQNYREKDLVAMEGVILRELSFELGHPTPEAFLKATVKLIRDNETSLSHDTTSPNTPTSDTFSTSTGLTMDHQSGYPTCALNGSFSTFGAGPNEDDAYRAYAEACTSQYASSLSAFTALNGFHSMTGYLGTNIVNSGFSGSGYLGTRVYGDSDASFKTPQQPPPSTSSTIMVTPETRAVARYLMEISTVHARYHRFKPSVLAMSALALADHILSDGPLVLLPESDSRSNASFSPAQEAEDVVRRCEAFLTDCLSDPPKQIFAKFAGGKFLRASMLAERWCKRQSIPIADSPQPSTPSPIAMATTHSWESTVSGGFCQQPRRHLRSAAMAVWMDIAVPAASPMSTTW